MRLQRIRTEPGSRAIRWSIEAPTPGVVLIDVFVGEGPTHQAPLHWRAGTWTKPPLDLWLAHDGRLVGLQFVLQDERVSVRRGTMPPEPEDGRPIFDTEGWPPDRFLDVTMSVEATRLPGGELALTVGDPLPPVDACRVGDGLVMGFGQAGGLVEIRIGPFGDEDWASIDAFAFVD